jgi:transaldolase/glucose-6-phosphate isomerase
MVSAPSGSESAARLLGPLVEVVRARRDASVQDHARLIAGDTSLWPPSVAGGSWLGWTASLLRARDHRPGIDGFVRGVLADGITDVVLTGMGGSSLFPEVLVRTFGSSPGHPRLWVIDSTDPAAVARIEHEVAWSSALLIAASKSGTTVETLAHLDRFSARLFGAHGEGVGHRIAVVTDPGSPLEQRARTEHLRGIILGDPDVGGRYSAFSPFGLLPAALLGVDLDAFISTGRSAEEAFAVDPWAGSGPALLASVMAGGAISGRDVLHLLVPESALPFAAWIEQLVAESTGKQGRGILPIVTESALDIAPDARRLVIAFGPQPGLERLVDAGVPVLTLPWEGRHQLAVEVVRWMQATALAGSQLGVDPFDQPDVAAAKAATATALASEVRLEHGVTLREVSEVVASDRPAYLAVLAYLDQSGSAARSLRAWCSELARTSGVPVTFGIGPRYLHSTGQLHKGGRPDGHFAVVVGDDPQDLEIPGRGFGFSRLKQAQAAGDVAALRAVGRRVDVVDARSIPD